MGGSGRSTVDKIDRMNRLTVLDETFEDEPGRTMDDFLRQVSAPPEEEDDG